MGLAAELGAVLAMKSFALESEQPVDAASGNRIERALITAARALSAHLSVEGAGTAALEAVEQVFGATSAWIMLYDDEARVLRTTVFRGAGSGAYKDVSIPVDGTVISSVAFRERKAIFIPDVHRETRWFDRDGIHGSGLRSLFMLPLVHGDHALGVIALDAPGFTAETPPSPHDVELLSALGAHAAVAISNAQLYEASEQDRRRLRALLKQRRELSGEVSRLRKEAREAYAPGAVIGDSAPFLEALHQAELVARADTTVLLLGETGTGKDLLAHLIHERSPRAKGPFVAVNCGALPENLVESELFGHERGAFTGAIARKAGSFEQAHRGTIFLDEIGDLPPEAQAKLLRVLQDRQVQRVGALRPTLVDVRVIAATNHDLEQAVARNEFRPDLFYRLGVFPIRLPALRERRADIPVLAEHFVRHFARKLGRSLSDVTPEALERLTNYRWPGNIRELQNVLERAVILTQGNVIEPDALYLPDIPSREEPAAPPPAALPDTSAPPPAPTSPGPATFADAERKAILDALEVTGWRISGRHGAAIRLGLKPTTLHAKMKKLGIRRPTAAQRTRQPGPQTDR